MRIISMTSQSIDYAEKIEQNNKKIIIELGKIWFYTYNHWKC